MHSETLYNRLMEESRNAYEGHAALCGFAPFPGNLNRQPMKPIDRPSRHILQNDGDLISKNYSTLQTAISDAAPAMRWRAIYQSETHDTSFMDKLGCFSIIGKGGPFASDTLRVFVVYMPAGLYYPWHIHPAEEIYLMISGSATFKRAGAANERLSEGQTMFHESNQPHAIETTDSPMLSLVVWRNHLETPPILVDGA